MTGRSKDLHVHVNYHEKDTRSDNLLSILLVWVDCVQMVGRMLLEG
jgi:hypothetical protein